MFKALQQRHAQFVGQAKWTSAIRPYLIEQCELHPDQRCLEVGCGTGAILDEWERLVQPACGVDVDLTSLQYASSHLQSLLAAADAAALPYASNHFDCVFAHFFFLWVSSPAQVLTEIQRCLKPGGWLLIFGEPDYSGRIDYPENLHSLREIQQTAFAKQGADPQIGRKLWSLLQASGYQNLSGGIFGSEWRSSAAMQEQLQLDFENCLLDAVISELPIDIQTLTETHQRACADGSRLMYVPTFFYSAQKSASKTF